MTAAPAAGEHGTHARGVETGGWRAIRSGAGRFWLEALMRTSRRAPSIPRLARPLLLPLAWRASSVLRDGPLANAARILGPESTAAERRSLARAVVSNFYEFVVEMGRFQALAPEELRSLIAGIDGHDRYRQARAGRRGAIIVTAHLGSFELGAAMLRAYEPSVHVVFRRDRLSSFERLRAEQRRRLGIREAALDDGWDVWLRLREALRADEVVMIQGDRVMPGQTGVRLPFFSGTVEFPTGPVKLAMATGAPLVPIYTVRDSPGRFRVHVDEPITVEPGPARWPEPHPALLRLASSIQRIVARYPEQWLVLHRAWCEDRREGKQGTKEGEA
jgi:phosphatidylinositol dimannoside acyltransferase